jgi:hypothetical protein
VPVDLDDVFTALSRQADAIPLAGAEHARRRGRQRLARSRAVLAAAAVVAVLAGTGLFLGWERPRPEPLLPATDPARIRGMAPVGEPQRVAEGRMWNNSRIAGDRVIGFSADGSGGHETVAVDARTGAALWRITSRDSFYRGVITTPKTVILLRELGQHNEALDEPADRILEFRDPATGVKKWELRHTDHDRLVLHSDVLARLVDESGAVEGYDLVTGRKLWSVPGAGTVGLNDQVPAKLITGMRIEADGAVGSTDSMAALFRPDTADAVPFTDDRLVELDRTGKITIRDIHTGAVRSTGRGRAGAEQMFAYEGTVYAELRLDDRLAVASPDHILYRSRVPWEYGTWFPCGRDRICVPEIRDVAQGRREAQMVMIDARTGAVVRTTGAVPRQGDNEMRAGHVLTSGTGEKATTLYDENGAAKYSDNGFGGFVDDGNALTLSQDAGDRRYTARSVSNVDFQKVKLGVVPEISGRCDWDEEILTCPAGRELWIWRFQR